VIAKWAITMDGRIATVTGESQWITSPASRAEVHQLRSRVDAVCVGMGTVEADDPMLTARLPDSSRPLREAARVVFCRSRVPSVNSKLVQSASDAPLWLVASQAIDPEQLKPLADLGAKVLATQTDDSVEMVRTALSDLAKQDMTNVMIEGGAELLASFLAADQIDEAHVYMGPKIFGGQNAKGPIGGQGIESITDLSSWELQSVDRFDSDVRVIYRKPTL
jgi:diaminohydroxyphosphoribosylaminopyrimidine deaminase/5-amino-6-(5-phosphoribosylamino)uracil reductase